MGDAIDPGSRAPYADIDASRRTGERILTAFRTGWQVLVLAALLGAGLAALYAALKLPTSYVATSAMYFTTRTGTSGSDVNQGATFMQNQMPSFAQLARSAQVLEPLAAELDGQMSVGLLRERIAVRIPQDTATMEIEATARVPDQAVEIANAAARSLAVTVEANSPTNGDESLIVASIISPASSASQSSNNSPVRYGVIGAVAGLSLGAGALAVRALLDRRVRSRADLRDATGVPVLATIPRSRRARGPRAEPFTASAVHAEAYRAIRAGIDAGSPGEGSRIVLFVSPEATDGTTTTALGTARAFAETGRTVTFVDLNLRRRHLSDADGIDGSVGVTSVLLDGMPVADASSAWPDEGITVVPTGPPVPNAGGLISSRALRTMLEDLRERSDVVVLDVAPLSTVVDAMVLAPVVDAVVLVASAQRTTDTRVREALDLLVGGNVVGSVLTEAERSPRDAGSLLIGASRAGEGMSSSARRPDARSDRAVPDGAVPDRAVPDRAVPDGAERAVPDGAVPDRAERAVPDRAVPDRAVPDGSGSMEPAPSTTPSTSSLEVTGRAPAVRISGASRQRGRLRSVTRTTREA